MVVKNSTVDATTAMLTDSNIPLEHRRLMLREVCQNDGTTSQKILQTVLDAAGKANGESLHAKKASQLSELIEAIENGPLRPATYFGLIDATNSHVRRAVVKLENGDTAYPVIPNESLQKTLRRGDTVLVDAQVRSVLFQDSCKIEVGGEAVLERRIDADRVEAEMRGNELFVFQVAAPLAEKLDSGEVAPGSRLLVCPRRAIAFDAVPTTDELAHYRYLVREPVPDVVLDRDVGCPPQFIQEVIEHLRREIEAPGLGRRYRLRRAITKLLVGVSGSGKTFAILALWRLMYELMSEVTGVPIDELPPRVLRLRLPTVLSKWLGEADKNLDRFFTEAEQLADDTFIAPDGTEYHLPCLIIGEEIDGLARSRGTSDAVYDRIQTTALERLDVNCRRLGDRFCVFLFTTNIPHMVDPAFIRRAGGTVERFGRLNRRSFAAVFEKHLVGLPLRDDTGKDHRQAERRVLRDVTDWLFSPNGHDPGQVELTYVGSSTPVVKYRRDLLTSALIDRAVQQASAEACKAERHGMERPGLTSELLISAFDRQVGSIVDQLKEHNVGDYLTLPDGVRVGHVRRVNQPSVQPYQLQRNGHA